MADCSDQASYHDQGKRQIDLTPLHVLELVRFLFKEVLELESEDDYAPMRSHFEE